MSLSEAFTACLVRGYVTVHLLRRECGEWTVIVESPHNHLRAYSAYSLRVLGSSSHLYVYFLCCLPVISGGYSASHKSKLECERSACLTEGNPRLPASFRYSCDVRAVTPAWIRDRRTIVGLEGKKPKVVCELGSPLLIYPRRCGSPVSYGFSSPFVSSPLGGWRTLLAAAIVFQVLCICIHSCET